MTQRARFLSLPFTVLAIVLILIGMRRDNQTVILLGVISLLIFGNSLWRAWRVQRAQRLVDGLLICPRCAQPGALTLHTLQRSQESDIASDEVEEHCSNCEYVSEPFTLKYPLDEELAGLLEHEDQARQIAERRAHGAWLRRKHKTTSP